MEWLKKLLEAQGLNEAQINVVSEGVISKYTGYVPPYRFEMVNTARKTATRALKERERQLEDFRKAAGDRALLEERIERMQAEIKSLQLSAALKLSLSGKVHDLDIVAALLDKTRIELDDSGAVKDGLDDQIKALQASKAFLFVPDGGAKRPCKGAVRRRRRGAGLGKRAAALNPILRQNAGKHST